MVVRNNGSSAWESLSPWGWVRSSSFQGSGRQEAKEEGRVQGKAPEGMGPGLTGRRDWGPC